MLRARASTVGFIALATFLCAAPAHASDPDLLWKIIRDRCVPNQVQHGDPAPCAWVDLARGVERGYVVLKDRSGKTQYLVMPSARVTGIESPLLRLPGAPNYFAAAWHEIGRVAEAAGHPLTRDELSLAVNSALGRTQDQLHIHLECVRADVRAALLSRLATIGAKWAPLGVPLANHRYLARRVPGATLDTVDPFKLLADGVPAAGAAMDQWTLVAVGVTFTDNRPGADGKPGFVLLADRVDPAAGDWASGEELQDHACALAGY